MPLVEAMETQRAVRRLLPDPVDDDTVLRVLELATKAPDRQQPAELGVRGRPRPRREAPARPAQPPGLVDLPPVGTRRAKGHEPTLKIIEAVQWQADHFEEVPVVIVACLHGRSPVFGPPVLASSWYGSAYPGGPEPAAGGPGRRPRRRPSPRSRCGRPRSPAAPSASPARSRRWPSSPWAGQRGGTARRPANRSETSSTWTATGIGPSGKLLLPELQAPGAPVAAGYVPVRCLQGR